MKKTKKNGFSLIIRAVCMQFKNTPVHMIILLIIISFEAIGLTARAISNQWLFDKIADASAGKAVFSECIKYAVLLGTITITQQIINGIKFFYIPVITDKSKGKNLKRIFSKLSLVAPVQFENVNFLNELDKAHQGIAAVTSVPIFILNIIFFDIIYAISIGGYLFKLCPYLILILLLAFIPALISQIFQIKIFSKLEDKTVQTRRECDSYNKSISDISFFKETRILGAFSFFYKRFSDSLNTLISMKYKAEKKSSFINLLLNFISFIGMGSATYLLFRATIDGKITVGAFAAIFSTLGQVFGIMECLMTWDISGITRDIGKVKNYFNIIDYEERQVKLEKKYDSEYVIADNISFKYPNTETNVLNNLKLKIMKGETIAIVGENGSGKSTLIRLLTGIYTPNSGNVSVFGCNSTSSDYLDYYSKISGIFQNFQKYKMTLEDNVTISDIHAPYFSSKIQKYLDDARVTYLSDSIKLDTMLSPEFGGIDISGGQWQRLAIARGLYRNKEFIILDEPTASIDPLEEAEIFEQFRNLAINKTTIIVTHRLGAVRLAQKIIVMDKGQIVDYGTHDELISHNGKYSEMWKAQAIWYER